MISESRHLEDIDAINKYCSAHFNVTVNSLHTFIFFIKYRRFLN